MKIFPVELIREADAYTIKNEPIAEIDLMERAATACFYWLIRNIPFHKKIVVFCGTGNNGGDGLVIARMMSARGYLAEVFILGPAEKFSESCRINYERVQAVPEIKTLFLAENDPLPEFEPETIVIDAIFGSGLTREPSGFYAKVIRHLNESKQLIVAIDVPSGLFCDRTISIGKNPVAIHADYTLTFSPPKLGFFFPENDKFAGKWQLLDIGIMQEFIDHADTRNFYIDQDDCRRILKPRTKFSHKGTFGHALLICGGPGKMGAAILAARGCLHAGPGLVSVHIPGRGVNILQTAVPEAMLDIDKDDSLFTGVRDLEKYSAIAMGPGIGTDRQTQAAVKLLIQDAGIPVIFDADALNILSENKTWITFIPKGSILTPHPKEFERLAGKSSDDFERNQKQRELSVKYSSYIILKGAHTAITTPDGRCFFNSTGNPGMATGGSGDILTGILAGLFAQGYSPLETCILGVYLHGLAGDLAAEISGQEALIAGDIADNLGKAFQTLY